jgi:hypothetical protein
MVSDSESRSAGEEAPLTQHVGGLCLAVMLLADGYQLGVSVGQTGARNVRWLRLADDAMRAEVWRMMGRNIEAWSRAGVVQRVELT